MNISANSKQQCPCCKRLYRSVIQHQRQSQCGSYQSELFESQNNNNQGCKSNMLDTHDAPINEVQPDTNGDHINDHEIFPQPDDGSSDIHIDENYLEQTNANVFHYPKSRTQDSFPCDNQLRGYTKILSFLDKLCAPKYAFDDLLELLTDLHHDGFSFAYRHKKRASVMKQLHSLFPTSNVERLPVTLESLNDNKPTVFVYRFDFKHQLRDLLRDELFYNVDNLVVNAEAPFGKYKPKDGKINEIQSGDWYSHTYDSYVSNPATAEIIIPLKLYCDKTGIDPMMQRHALEPLMFSTTIISRETQQKSNSAWRHIGFIPDLDKSCAADKHSSSNHPYDRGMHVRNYHKCLNLLLEPIVDLQSSGMTVNLQIGDYYKRVHAYFPISVIAGDSKSNDLWCCRLSHYNQPRMSRACYTSFDQCNDPWVVCQWVVQQDQLSLQNELKQEDARDNEHLMDRLKEVSTYRFDSILFKADFGMNPNGQFSACTVDPMHMFESGVLAMVCKAFVAMLNGQAKKLLDQWALQYCKNSRSTSKKFFPRVDFSGGITKLTNIASHEWAGILLVYLLAVSSISGKKFLKNMFDESNKRYERKREREKKRTKRQRKREKLLRSNNLLTRGNDYDIIPNITKEDHQIPAMHPVRILLMKKK